MKSSRIWCGLLVVVIVIYGFWNWYYCCNPSECCDKHYVDVYIDDDGIPYTLERDTGIDELLVFPGDYVVWNNAGEGEVKLMFPGDNWFGQNSVTISPNKRVILRVASNAAGNASYTISCSGNPGVGSPKVKIGEIP